MVEFRPVPRNTARGIVIHDGKILLMERWRGDLHYFSIPGGGIEEGEQPDRTVKREIAEETTVSVDVIKHVITMRDGHHEHQIFICKYLEGEPELPSDSQEAVNQTPNNRFRPLWVNLDELSDLSLGYWQPIRQALLDGIKDGFSDEVVIVSPGSSR